MKMKSQDEQLSKSNERSQTVEDEESLNHKYLYGHSYNYANNNMSVQNNLERQLKVTRAKQQRQGSKMSDLNEEQKELITASKEYSKNMMHPDFKAYPDETFLRLNYDYKNTIKNAQSQGAQGN